ncbi:hypothetical protein P7K49_025957 [Saguinus oedipus]|uniref:Uncharacterized protein n=1 Tax=Saguinus oedipus TaxID=9490 RepID=A0ABQ9UK55_SAGOE|nr:hypothetical protein P7K49_025957 [Saguinus oedipus]
MIHLVTQSCTADLWSFSSNQAIQVPELKPYKDSRKHRPEWGRSDDRGDSSTGQNGADKLCMISAPIITSGMRDNPSVLPTCQAPTTVTLRGRIPGAQEDGKRQIKQQKPPRKRRWSLAEPPNKEEQEQKRKQNTPERPGPVGKGGKAFRGTNTKVSVQKGLLHDEQRPGQPWSLESQRDWPASFPNHWLHGDLQEVGRLTCENLGQRQETRRESSTRPLEQTQRSAAECLVDPGFFTMLCALWYRPLSLTPEAKFQMDPGVAVKHTLLPELQDTDTRDRAMEP